MRIINTPFGLYRCNHMCFGVASSPAQFHCCMDTMTTGLTGVAAYLDNLIVTGGTAAKHWENLKKLMYRLGKYSLRIKLAKCEFLKDSFEYLRHIIEKDGKRRNLTIAQDPESSGATSIFGKNQLLRSFIKNLPDKANPLYALLKKTAKFKWSDACETVC